ncbi:MAG: 6-bladed beta-propeller, partial [Tannerella sp.]|nr:6-bladed beta-propeller [Tannerella sp.]
MKRSKLIILVAIVAGCVGCKQSGKQSTGDIITVDVTASYPEKELILQDFMDVEYVPLETNDEFITHGVVEAVGKDILLARNWADGNIFIFDRTGKGIRKINRLGQGGEEYTSVNGIVLDEDTDEMFVSDYSARKIMVYDLYGNFKRSLQCADSAYYSSLFNYDRNQLICYKTYSPIDTEESGHILISKQDGSIARKIPIPFKEIKTTVFIKEDLVVMPVSHQTLFPYQGNLAIVNTSSDTMYTYLPDGSLLPFMVRTPSIYAMDTEVFLFPGVLCDRYSFMKTMKKEVDLVKLKGFPTTDLVYDKQEKALFSSAVYNDDFSDKRQVSLTSP